MFQKKTISSELEYLKYFLPLMCNDHRVTSGNSMVLGPDPALPQLGKNPVGGPGRSDDNHSNLAKS